MEYFKGVIYKAGTMQAWDDLELVVPEGVRTPIQLNSIEREELLTRQLEEHGLAIRPVRTDYRYVEYVEKPKKKRIPYNSKRLQKYIDLMEG